MIRTVGWLYLLLSWWLLEQVYCSQYYYAPVIPLYSANRRPNRWILGLYVQSTEHSEYDIQTLIQSKNLHLNDEPNSKKKQEYNLLVIPNKVCGVFLHTNVYKNTYSTEFQFIMVNGFTVIGWCIPAQLKSIRVRRDGNFSRVGESTS